MKREGKRRVRASTLRVLSALGVAALVCLGLALHTGTGTPSSFGIADIAALCPLGGVEAAIASRTVVPPLLIGLAVVVALTLLLGRAFCAWGCPVPLLRAGVSRKEGLEARCFFTGFRASRCPGVRARGLARFAQLGAGRGHPLDGCVRVPGVLPCVPGRFDVRNARRGVEGVPVQRGHLVASGVSSHARAGVGSAAEMVPSVLSAGSAAVVGVARQPHVPAAGERRDVLACGSRRALPSVRRRVPGRHRLA